MRTPQRYLRQSRLVPPALLKPLRVHVIGLGSLGNPAAIQLATMGVGNIHLCDHDHVAESNLGTQGYATEDVGHTKVFAAARRMMAINPTITVHEVDKQFSRALGRSLNGAIVLSCVDSMKVRKFIAETSQENNAALFIDGRIGGETGRVYTSTPDTWEGYMGTLFDDSEVERNGCGTTTTINTPVTVASLMVSQVTKFARSFPVDPLLMVNLLACEVTRGRYGD